MKQMTPVQIEKLSRLRSAPRFVNQAGGTPRVECKLVDTLHRNVWATGIGSGWSVALDADLEGADESKRPRTPEETAQENVLLKRRLAKYERENEALIEYEEPPKPVAQAEPDEPPIQLPITDELPAEADSAGPGDNLGNLTSEELSQAIKSRGLEPPEGDRRTREWRDTAIDMIAQPA